MPTPTPIEQLTAEVTGFTGRAGRQLSDLAARMQELEQKVARRGGPPAHAHGQSWGAQVASHDGLREFITANRRGKFQVPVRSNLAAITTGSIGSRPGGAVTVRGEPEPVMLGRAQMGVRDLIPTVNTDAAAIEFTRQTLRTLNAGVVSEGELKPESTMDFELVTLPARTIAHWIVTSRQILADAPSLQNAIDTDMRYGLQLAEAEQVLSGDGTGVNLHGIIPQAEVFAAPFSATFENRFDVLLQAIGQASQARLPVTGIALNDLDLLALMGTKDEQGRYVGGGPLSVTGGIVRIWNVPTIGTPAMDPDDFLVGAFRDGSTLYDRDAAEVMVSTEDSDNFRRNLATVLAEERVILTVKRPQAFVTGTFPVVSG